MTRAIVQFPAKGDDPFVPIKRQYACARDSINHHTRLCWRFMALRFSTKRALCFAYLPHLRSRPMNCHPPRARLACLPAPCELAAHEPNSSAYSGGTTKRGAALLRSPAEEDLVVLVRQRLLPRGHAEVRAVERKVGVVRYRRRESCNGVRAHRRSRQGRPQPRRVAGEQSKWGKGARKETQSQRERSKDARPPIQQPSCAAGWHMYADVRGG